MASAAWTRKEGKSKSGGLNAKGRASYKGGTLKAPTKSKTSSRRKSFCARMGGMKKKLTSAKTARDPNSRINKSLRKWDCQMRDTKVLETFLKNNYKKIKEMSLFRHLKKEVNAGANGTQDYIIKKGPNKDKVAKK